MVVSHAVVGLFEVLFLYGFLVSLKRMTLFYWGHPFLCPIQVLKCRKCALYAVKGYFTKRDSPWPPGDKASPLGDCLMPLPDRSMSQGTCFFPPDTGSSFRGITLCPLGLAPRPLIPGSIPKIQHHPLRG